MSELSYKELQEQGIFDVPYRAFEYMQSQQSKIDSLNKNIEALHVENDRIQKEYQMMFEGVQGRQKTIDELQGRIDGAMKYVSESPLKDVSRRAMINFMDILKGNKDEN